MTYEEAIKLARDWTQGVDVSQDGWRSVIAILLQRNTLLETYVVDLTTAVRRLQLENQFLRDEAG